MSLLRLDEGMNTHRQNAVIAIKSSYTIFSRKNNPRTELSNKFRPRFLYESFAYDTISGLSCANTIPGKNQGESERPLNC